MDMNGDEKEYDQQTDKENELAEESEEEQPIIEARLDEERECDDEDEDCLRQAMHSDSDDSGRDSRVELIFDEKNGYKNVKFFLHQRFRDASVFRMALQAYAVEKGFEYLLKRNEKCKISVICKASGCRFYMYASQNPRSEYLVLRHFFEAHDCRTSKKALITSQYLAIRYLDQIRASPKTSAKSLQELVQLDLQLVVTPSKCYRAIRKAQEVVSGESYNGESCKQSDLFYVPKYYASNTFKAICAPLVKPVGGPVNPPGTLPLKKRMKGRNELKTCPNNPYKAAREATEPLCGHCRKKGHNKRTCPELNKSDSTQTRKVKHRLHMSKKRAEQRAESSEDYQDSDEPPSSPSPQRERKKTVTSPERERVERSREVALSRLRRRKKSAEEPQVDGGTTSIVPYVGIVQAELDVSTSTPMDKNGPNDEVGPKIFHIHHGKEQDRSEEEQILERDIPEHDNEDSDDGECDSDEEEYDQQTDKENELAEESEQQQPQQPISEARFDEEREHNDDEDCFRQAMHSDTDDSSRDSRMALLFDENSGYKNVKFALHQRFRDASVFRMALQAYAVEKGFEYLLKRNEKCKISVICKASGCRFYMYASQNPRSECLVLRHFFEAHDCKTSRKAGITSQYLAIRYLDQIRASPTMSAKSLQELVQLDLQIVLKPSKCYRAIKRAHEVINGALYKQFDWLHVPTRYATNTFKAICSPLVKPVGCPVNPPVILTPPGRNELKTSPNNPYKAARDATDPSCGHCRKKGHNKRTCPELNESDSTQPRKEKRKLHMRKKRAEQRAKSSEDFQDNVEPLSILVPQSKQENAIASPERERMEQSKEFAVYRSRKRRKSTRVIPVNAATVQSSEDFQDNVEPLSTLAPQSKRENTVAGPEGERTEQSREIVVYRVRKRRKPSRAIPVNAATVQEPEVGEGLKSSIPADVIAQAEQNVSRSTPHALDSGRESHTDTSGYPSSQPQCMVSEPCLDTVSKSNALVLFEGVI